MFTSAAQTAQAVTATFEVANQAAESTEFDNYGHITAGHASTTPGNSQYLNGSSTGMVGVAKSYRVYPSDQLKIEAYGSYNAPGSSSSSLANFVPALLSALQLPTPVVGETGTAASGISTWGGMAAMGYGDGSNDNTDPKAFVNIVLFDNNYNFLDVASAQLKGTSLYYMSQTYTVKEAGYAYLYVSNEQSVQTDVYFDDVTMTYTPTNILQSNEYYPFGLQTSNSWTRDNAVQNNSLYDAGNEANTTTAMYDLPFRNYDAALGRMFQIDPLATSSHSLNPYHYAGNNPIGSNDPTGLMQRYWDPSWGNMYNLMSGGGAENFDDAVDYSSQSIADLREFAQQMEDQRNAGSVTNSVAEDGTQSTLYTGAAAQAYFANYQSNLITDRYDVTMTQNGTTFGYYLDVNSAGSVVAVTRSNLAKNDLTYFDYGGYNGIVTDTRLGDSDLDPSTVGNWFFNYGGPSNPKSYDGTYNYSVSPKNMSDKLAYNHDKGYDKKNAVGALDLVLNPSVIQEDATFIAGQLQITGLYLGQFSSMGYSPAIDPITGQPYTLDTAVNAFVQGIGLGLAATPKMAINLIADIFK